MVWLRRISCPAEKAHARHDLRGDTGRIQRRPRVVTPEKPYLETTMMSAAASATIRCVRIPAFQTVVAFVTDEAAAYPGDEDAKKNSSSVKTVMSMSLPLKVQSVMPVGVAVHAVPVKSRKETWRKALEGEAIREKHMVPPDLATTIQGFDRNSASALQHSGVHHGFKRCSSMPEKPYGPSATKSSPRGKPCAFRVLNADHA